MALPYTGALSERPPARLEAVLRAGLARAKETSPTGAYAISNMMTMYDRAGDALIKESEALLDESQAELNRQRREAAAANKQLEDDRKKEREARERRIKNAKDKTKEERKIKDEEIAIKEEYRKKMRPVDEINGEIRAAKYMAWDRDDERLLSPKEAVAYKQKLNDMNKLLEKVEGIDGLPADPRTDAANRFKMNEESLEKLKKYIPMIERAPEAEVAEAKGGMLAKVAAANQAKEEAEAKVENANAAAKAQEGEAGKAQKAGEEAAKAAATTEAGLRKSLRDMKRDMEAMEARALAAELAVEKCEAIVASEESADAKTLQAAETKYETLKREAEYKAFTHEKASQAVSNFEETTLGKLEQELERAKRKAMDTYQEYAKWEGKAITYTKSRAAKQQRVAMAKQEVENLTNQLKTAESRADALDREANSAYVNKAVASAMAQAAKERVATLTAALAA